MFEVYNPLTGETWGKDIGDPFVYDTRNEAELSATIGRIIFGPDMVAVREV